MTRDELRQMLMSAHSEDEARAALAAGEAWMAEHPDDKIVWIEMSGVSRLLSSFAPA